MTTADRTSRFGTNLLAAARADAPPTGAVDRELARLGLPGIPTGGATGPTAANAGPILGTTAGKITLLATMALVATAVGYLTLKEPSRAPDARSVPSPSVANTPTLVSDRRAPEPSSTNKVIAPAPSDAPSTGRRAASEVRAADDRRVARPAGPGTDTSAAHPTLARSEEAIWQAWSSF